MAPDGLKNISIPAGVGGGFVQTGPFANMTVNLGPVGGLNGTAPGPNGGLGYNPRGLKRDVGPAVNMRYANYSTVLGKFLGTRLVNREFDNALTKPRTRPLVEAKHLRVPRTIRRHSLHHRDRASWRHTLRDQVGQPSINLTLARRAHNVPTVATPAAISSPPQATLHFTSIMV